TPLKSTLEAPPKAFPLIVTVAPTAAAEGVNPVTFGSTASVAALVAVPPPVVTEIVPVLAPAGTVSRTWSADSVEKPAATPFTFPNPEPAIVTSAPAAALAGANEVSFGSTLNVPTLNPVPPGFVTPICPVSAVAGTTALICEAETIVEGTVDTPPNVTALAP